MSGKWITSKQMEIYMKTRNKGRTQQVAAAQAGISKEEYDEIITGFQAERHNVEVRLKRLTEADDCFNKSLSTIFALASKAHDLFKSSELEEKRRIITILFPNLEMSAEKLVF